MGVTLLNNFAIEAYLPEAHRERAERLRQLWLLYTGRHAQYFVTEKRSRFTFRRVGEDTNPFYAPFDLLSLVSRKTADLLFGEAPRIRATDAGLVGELAELIERSSLQATLLSAAIECSWAGDAYVEVVVEDGRAIIQHLPSREVFPATAIDAAGQARRYVRYATETITEGDKRTLLLLETTYEPGAIRRAVWELGDGGDRKAATTLARWPVKQFDGNDLAEEVRTGMADVSIVRFRNDAQGESDYTIQLIALQDTLSAKTTQLARIMLKHADPLLFVATSQAGPDGNLRTSDGVLYGDSPDAMPKFVTWESQSTAALEDRKFALLAFATAAEMPLSYLGVKDDATAESAAKMRLSATNAISKAQRKAAYYTAGIRLAIVRAFAAQNRLVEPAAISVQTRDGIPDDESERANVIATLRAAGAISLRRSLSMQQLDDAEIEIELKQIKAEQAATSPSSLFGETNEIPPDDQSELGGAINSSAGIAAEQTLNGAQINAAIDVIGQMQAGSIGQLTAVEMLVAVGIERSRATAMVTDSGTRSGAGDINAA
jgi:hypothetical protein